MGKINLIPREKPAEAGSWRPSDSALASLLGALISAIFAAMAFKLNRSTAYRTATIEAQTLLVEINKQYISDPALLAMEGDPDAPISTDKNFNAKLKAMAYLKLNVFEIIFAALPRGQESEAWKAYIEDSLDRCNILADELEKNRRIYQRDLIRAYEQWKAKKKPSLNQLAKDQGEPGSQSAPRNDQD